MSAKGLDVRFEGHSTFPPPFFRNPKSRGSAAECHPPPRRPPPRPGTGETVATAEAWFPPQLPPRFSPCSPTRRGWQPLLGWTEARAVKDLNL